MTLFDAVAGLVLIVSALVGLVRGVVRELVSLFAFALASAASVFLLPVTGPLARHSVHPGWAANAVAVAVVFLVAYVAVKVLGASLSATLRRRSTLGAMDRAVGLGFGIVRALVLLGVFYLVFSAVPRGFAPQWVSKSALFPLSRASGGALAALAPSGLRAMGGFGHLLKERANDGASPDDDTNATDSIDSAAQPTPASPVPDPYEPRRDARLHLRHRTPSDRDSVQMERP